MATEIPEQWREVDTSPFTDDGEVIGAAIRAAASLRDFFGTFTNPGVLLITSRIWAERSTESELLELFSFKDYCDYKERTNYDDGRYKGIRDLYINCSGDGNLFVLAAAPLDSSFIVLLVVAIGGEADLQARDRILGSLKVVGDLP